MQKFKRIDIKSEVFAVEWLFKFINPICRNFPVFKISFYLFLSSILQINLYWLPEMYLKQRFPLPVNSNPAYIFPRQYFETEFEQVE